MRIDPDLRRNDRSRKSKLNTIRSEWIQGGLQKLDYRTIDAGIDRVRGVNSTQMKKTLDRALRSKTWFALLIVLSPPRRTVLGLVLGVI